ncbi:hypothetical protein [Streptococcus oralis]|uniref:Uncharacterized protein n=1 Tax=Streptococcus oralis TaxID=1303 RepID=A0A139PB18_STROR|nr:hypothetical protein [Streptococcus oralis]KXT85537.1 hypothetical protein SORDD16_01437 [Streptococcus oralis]
MFRALVTYVYKHLSPAEVREAADFYEKVGNLAGLIPKYGDYIHAFYALSASDYRYAADRGWGVDLLITLAPYNPN